jgi:NADH:ubiquinone oxidoreductase subunit K
VTDSEHPTPTIDKSGYKEAFLPFGDPDARDPDPEVRKRFFGKYRGTVLENEDPLEQGRLIVSVPDVLGILPSTWATPCLPFAGPLMGQFVRPVIGAGVWVEFEQGDPQMPIWTGCYWGDPPQILPVVAEESLAEPGVPVVTIETATGGLSICDVPLGPFGMVCLRSGEAMISLTEAEITIEASSINLISAGAITLDAETVAIAATEVTIAAGETAVAGNMTVGGTQSVTGAATFAGAVTFEGAATVGGAFTVGGAATFGGAVTIAGVLTVDGIVVP